MSATAPTAVATVRNLTKIFCDFWGRARVRAVDGIDFEIRQGEVLALLGPNGSGKSTTVKMLLGLLYPTSGTITVFGKSPRAVETKKLIGYLPEETTLYPYLTARETLDFFGSLFHLSAAERRMRIDQLLDMVGLAHARERRVGEFSKGMARRIGLAQAMINDPDFLILDEPTSGLDPIGCREVKDLILLLKKRGKTVLVTSHLLGDVEDVCDRAVILYGGKIRSQGRLDELLTMQERCRLTLPAVPDEILAEIRTLLQQRCPGEEIVADHPRRTLEEYFLQVVREAREQNLATSGAAPGGAIADYLNDDAASQAVLENLLDRPVSVPAADAAPPADEAAREKKIAELTREEPPREKAAPSPSDRREKLERAEQ
ncbi:MAG: ABC transporter ATP-binding protein, partial [Victivallaceae bacterium]|nr:ABC transporter ATP-binding protein [Victivallaceae bacterium]